VGAVVVTSFREGKPPKETVSDGNSFRKNEQKVLSLRRAGGALPAYVMVAGTRMGAYVFNDPHLPFPPRAQPLPMQFQLPTILIEDFSTIEEYRQALKPLFDAIWNAAGYERSKSYDAEGRWIRRS
jgi:hypothetical protein